MANGRNRTVYIHTEIRLNRVGCGKVRAADMRERQKAIRIHPRDNVAVAVQDLNESETLRIHETETVTREPIPLGHKVALAAIDEGESVVKYGFPIGCATARIEPGAWVHVQNVHTNLSGLLEYRYEPDMEPVAPADDGTTFDGFPRPDGEAGVRNEVWIVPTVGCVNEVAKTLARRMNENLPAGTVEGVYAWPHPHGCSQFEADLERTQKILAGLVNHPNAGGVLVLGLGCEHNRVESFQPFLGETSPDRVKFLVCQQVNDEVEVGLGLLQDLCEYAGGFQREPVPVSRLRVGLKCGGSDGLSGITGNPLVGVFCDRLVARGGTTALTEVPEMFGAETLLMKRCVSQEVFNKCVGMINNFKAYFLLHGRPIDENPSPGNRDSGLTTLEEKSLGCVQKGGTSPVVDVLQYGERLRKPGLNLIAGPGNDPVAATVLAAAGAHLILFTTGRGTPLGTPVPTVKISTNSDLAARKSGWIDFDAGVLLEGASMQETADRFFPYVLEVASGRKRTRNEENGFREIVIFKDGVTG